MANEAFESPLHRSLTRPILFTGGERKLVMSLGILILSSIFGTGLSAMGIGLAVFVAVFGFAGVRALAKRDPQMSEVVQRYNQYKTFYPAKAHPSAPVGRVKSGLKSSI